MDEAKVNLKKCGACKELKALEHFQFSVGRFYSSCKPCHSKRVAAWRAKQDPIQLREKQRASAKRLKDKRKLTSKAKHLQRYNISVEQWATILAEQDFSCGICKKHYSSFDRSLAVDHDHITGKVRGLLCFSCNTGLGHFKDNTLALIQAVKYLKRVGQTNER